MSKAPTKFHLRIYDNGQYMEEEEAYNHGAFDTYGQAISAAQKIVDEFFAQNWKPGLTADDLLSQYSLYGEDPVILPNETGEYESFSARTYATISAAKVCGEKK